MSQEGLLSPVLWALRGILISTQQNQVGGLGLLTQLASTPESLVCLFSVAAETNHYKFGGLNSINVFSQRSGGQKSEAKVYQ